MLPEMGGVVYLELEFQAAAAAAASWLVEVLGAYLTQVLTAESFLSPTPGYNLGSRVLLSLSFVRYVTSP